MEWTGYDFCAWYVQWLHSRSTAAGFLGYRVRIPVRSFVLALYIKVQEQTHKNNPQISAFVVYRMIATKVVDSMNFVAVVVHFVISTIYVENYETQQIHNLGESCAESNDVVFIIHMIH